MLVVILFLVWTFCTVISLHIRGWETPVDIVKKHPQYPYFSNYQKILHYIIVCLIAFIVSPYTMFRDIYYTRKIRNMVKKRGEKVFELVTKCLAYCDEWDSKHLETIVSKKVKEIHKKRILIHPYDIACLTSNESAHNWFMSKMASVEEILASNKEITMDNFCDKDACAKLFSEI